MQLNMIFLIQPNYCHHWKRKFAGIFFWQVKSTELLDMKKLVRRKD